MRVSKNSTIIAFCCAVTIFFPLANFFPARKFFVSNKILQKHIIEIQNMRPPRRAARATRSYANDGEGEDKAMLDAEMGSASEEEEEEEGEEEEGEEEEEEEEESVPDDDEEDEEDEESEEMIDSIDEEEEAAGFNRERATKVAGSLRVLSKRSEKKREKKRAATRNPKPCSSSTLSSLNIRYNFLEYSITKTLKILTE